MKAILVFIVTVLLLSGCASVAPVVTAQVEIRSGTNSVVVSQPKDTTIEELEWDPKSGHLVLRGYRSSSKVEAIAAAEASAKAQAEGWASMARAFELGAEAAAASQGVRVPDRQPTPRSASPPAQAPISFTAPAPQPPTLLAPPDWKVVPGPGGLYYFERQDTPSTPHLVPGAPDLGSFTNIIGLEDIVLTNSFTLPLTDGSAGPTITP